MLASLESRVRRVVADTLGVGGEDLAADVSLVDDLAADSLDLLEIAIALEAELGIPVPERLLDGVRTYGELLHTTLALASPRTDAEVERDAPGPAAWTRLIAPAIRHAGELLRAERLTPYILASISEDARAVGPGARLEVTVAPETTDAGLARVRAELAPLETHGIALSIERERPNARTDRHPTRARA
jgi:acyl carrier protein